MPHPSDADTFRRRLEPELAHLWMVRTFLKHAEEFEDDVELMRIPRAIFDFVRAVETRMDADDPAELLKMLRKKLPRLRSTTEQFAAGVADISDHTNFKMSAASLSASVRELERILADGSGD